MSAEHGRGVAFARAALAGNPSDGYGGAVLAVSVANFCARVCAMPAPGLEVRPASELVSATVRRFARELEPAALGSALRWSTSIPRSVGLGGSSAIVIATLRALCGLCGVGLERSDLAAFALAVETEDLGISAGPQDRVAQAYGGLTFMDFASCRSGCNEQLRPPILPPLLIAWHEDAAETSDSVHSELRLRFERGEPALRRSIAELGELARSARSALLAGDRARFAGCVDASFDARARMMRLNPRHVSLIESARERGASANYAGSGGAVVVVCRDEVHRRDVAAGMTAVGCEVIAATVDGTTA